MAKPSKAPCGWRTLYVAQAVDAVRATEPCGLAGCGCCDPHLQRFDRLLFAGDDPPDGEYCEGPKSWTTTRPGGEQRGGYRPFYVRGVAIGSGFVGEHPVTFPAWTVVETCRGRSAKDWPVCRSHLAAWLSSKDAHTLPAVADIKHVSRLTDFRAGQLGLDPSKQWAAISVAARGAVGKNTINYATVEDLAVMADMLDMLGRGEERDICLAKAYRQTSLPGLDQGQLSLGVD